MIGGPKGNYSWAPLYFNFDGTFAYLAGANEGAWVQVDDMIMLRFKKGPETENNAVYSGNTTRNFMSGIMMSSDGEKGHWYAVKKGTRLFSMKDGVRLPYLKDRESKTKIDPAGKK